MMDIDKIIDSAQIDYRCSNKSVWEIVKEAIEAALAQDREEREGIMLDERCPENIGLELYGISEQCGKVHYWNAAWRCHRLMADLLKKFHNILNEHGKVKNHKDRIRIGSE